MQFINQIGNVLRTCGGWLKDKFSCRSCKLLAVQVSLLQDEISRLDDRLASTDNERLDLQAQLLELLNPMSTPKATPQPIGGMRNWRSFIGGRYRERKNKDVGDLPDIPTIEVES